MAAFFGTSPEFAAFLVAFRCSQVLRRLFGEGALVAGFIPHFERLRSESPIRAGRYFWDLHGSMILLLGSVVVVAELLLWGLLQTNYCSVASEQIIFLMQWMLPGLLFICLYALFGALLQCERYYFLPAVAPLLFNLVWIGAAWWTRTLEVGEAVVGLAIGVTIAYAVQWLVTAPPVFRFLRAQEVSLAPHRLRPFSQEVRTMAKPLTLAVLGVGAAQINNALDMLLARCAALEGPAYLGYASRLYQVPVALFGLAVASALLPPLARAATDRDRFQQLLSFGWVRMFAFLFPCLGMLLVMGYSAVSIAYLRGQFTTLSALHTTHCLWAYGLGLLPHAAVNLLTPALFALHEFRFPAIGSILAVVVHLMMTLFLVLVIQAPPYTVALATTVASLCNACFLSYCLQKQGICLAPAWSRLLRIALITLLASGAALLTGQFVWKDPSLQVLQGFPEMVAPSLTHQVQQLFGEGLAFVVTFLLGARLFCVDEVLSLLRLGANRLRSRS